MNDFDKQYTRFPFLVLPYTMKHMGVTNEIIIDYDAGILYCRDINKNLIPLSDSGFIEHIEDIDNPHNTTAKMLELENVLNIRHTSKHDFDNHVNNFNNPHRVTKKQIGLENVPNIMQASKVEFDNLKNKYELIRSEVEELLSRPEYQKLYELILDTVPEDAIARVFYNDKWNEGKIHNVPSGEYKYEVFVGETEIKYNLIINTNPHQSKVEVFYDGKWNLSKNHLLPNGTYDIRVSSLGYNTYESKVTISNIDKVENILLIQKKFNLTINTIPEDCSVKVYYDTKFNDGKTHSLVNGEYMVIVSKDGYDLKEEKIIIENLDKTISIELDKSKYNLTINTTPIDAVVEVFYNDKWNIGKTHKLINGSYEIKVTKDKYIEKTITSIINNNNKTETVELSPIPYDFTINTTPIDALVEVYYNNQWNLGKVHNIPNGTYPIRVSKEDYVTKEDNIVIEDSTKIVEISLELKKYNLKINVDPIDSIVKVKIDGLWESSIDNIFNVIPGNYEVIVEKEGYKSNTTIAIVGKSDTNTNIALYKLYELTINTIPILSSVRLKIDGLWIDGNVHHIPTGSYEVEVESEGYYKHTSIIKVTEEDKSVSIELDLLKYTLSIDTTPIDSIVSVFYNNQWNIGKVHSLSNGNYQVNISRDNYFTQNHNIIIQDSDLSKEYILIEEKYTLTIDTVQQGTVVEVFYNDTWNIGTSHLVSNGYYNIRISKDGYNTKLDTILVNGENKNVVVELTLL